MNIRSGWIISLLVVLGLAGCAGKPFTGPDEIFSMLWADTAGAIHARFSTDGASWKTAKFPSASTPLGVGVAAEPLGYMYLATWPDTSNDRIGIFGLGPDGYTIIQPATIGKKSSGTMSSAAAIAAANASRWYFAYRDGQMSRVFLMTRVPDKTNPQQWVYTWKDQSPTINGNNFVTGRPSISIKGTRVVVTWFRKQGQLPGAIWVAYGDLQSNGDIAWVKAYPFAYSAPNAGVFLGPHDLTHDHKNFIVAVLREDLSGPGGLKTNSLHLHTSADGDKWALKTSLGSGTAAESLGFSGPVGIAAHSNGTLVAAQIKADEIRAFRFANSKWAAIAGSNFKAPRLPDSDKHFALITGGVAQD